MYSSEVFVFNFRVGVVENVPESQSFISSSGDDVFAVGRHAHVYDSAGVAEEALLLADGLDVPDDGAVEAVAVRADEVLAVRAEVQVADLRSGVDRVQQRAVVGVPDLDGLVLRAPARDEQPGQRGTPGERLDGRGVLLEFVHLLVAPDVPDLEFVFVSARSQTLVEFVVLEAADLLLVFAEFEYALLLAHVPVHDVFVPRATELTVLVLVFDAADAAGVEFILAYDFLRLDVYDAGLSRDATHDHSFAPVQELERSDLFGF